MSKSLLDTLPTEILCIVAEYLSTEDLKNLSLANSVLRTIIASRLFEVLQVDCPLREDHIAGAVLRKYGAHVVELRLNVTFFPNKVVDKRLGSLLRNFFRSSQRYRSCQPASAWARRAVDIPVIHDLLQFKDLPRCKSLTLHTRGDDDFIHFEDDNNSTDAGITYTSNNPENWEDVERKEQRYSWRAALRDMYRDVANLSSAVELKISSFLPRKVSFWRKDEWAGFLGRLKKLTLHPYGANAGAQRNVDMFQGSHELFRNLSSLMLTHATVLEHLEIVAHESGFLGGDSLVLAPNTMPSLRVLHLENVAATSILPNFLQGTHKDLSKIHIVNCVAQIQSSIGEDQPSWGDLWMCIREAVPEPKEIMCILPKMPLTWKEVGFFVGDGYVRNGSEWVEAKSLAARVTKERNSYIWPYAHVRMYGSVRYDDEMNVKKLMAEEDNLEYKAMVEAVESVGG
ncbi:hypothetical protein ACHAQI_012103 [Fusarium lateritium]